MEGRRDARRMAPYAGAHRDEATAPAGRGGLGGGGGAAAAAASASEASEVSVVSPDEIAGRKWPALYRSRPASAAAASFLYAQSLLLPAFEKAGSRPPQRAGQHHSPVFRLPSPQPRRRSTVISAAIPPPLFSMYDRVSLGAF